MSFAAVTILVGLLSQIQGQTRGEGWFDRAYGHFKTLALTSIFAGLSIGPIAAFHFQLSATYGVIANLITMPAFSFIVMRFSALAAVMTP